MQQSLNPFGNGDKSIRAESNWKPSDASDETVSHPKLGFQDPDCVSLSKDTRAARQADWVVFTGRYPYVFDAARLGFGIGHREDSSYQWTPDEVSLPVHFLDNDYRDADLERFIERVYEYEPDIAVLGDIYDIDDLDQHLKAAGRIRYDFPDIELILVPKCKEVLSEIPDDIILGFPNGKSKVQGLDIASYRDWRSVPNRIHILGGTPLSAHEHIVQLTRETVTDIPKADIAGLDYNGFQKFAENHGDYADANGGWHRNLREEYAPKRDLIRYSLLNAKHYWISQRVWPTAESVNLPSRDELLSAHRGGPINIDGPKDAKELLFSPLPRNKRQTQPIYRTDETQAEIIEPLSPVAAFLSARGDFSWEPAGTLSTPVSYHHPVAHTITPTCPGCGSHAFADQGNCNTESENATVSIISYEHQATDREEHYESVPTDATSALEYESHFPAIRCYCSDVCRDRAEGATPHQITNRNPATQNAYPNGKVLGKLSI